MTKNTFLIPNFHTLSKHLNNQTIKLSNFKHPSIFSILIPSQSAFHQHPVLQNRFPIFYPTYQKIFFAHTYKNYAELSCLYYHKPKA